MSDPPTPVHFRPGVADVLFLLLALMVLRGAQHTLLDDPGLGWHIRNIDAILQQGWWLTEDPFSDHGNAPATRWYTNQWLGELPYWLGWKWARLEGIAVVNALIIATMVGVLYRLLLADGLLWPVAMAWTSLAAMGTSCSWNARPNVFSILYLLLTARACVYLHEGKLTRAHFAGILVLFCLWANTHGGFIGGLLTLAITFAIELVLTLASLDPVQHALARQRSLLAGGLTVGAFLATLINPYGIDLYRWVFQLLGDPFFMDLHQEWRSPDFHSGGAMRYELLLLLFPLLLGWTNRRPHLVELALAIVWLHFALTGFRYVALWVVVVVPLLARSSTAISYLHELAKKMHLHAGPDSLFYTPPGRPTWIWSGLLALLLLILAKGIEGRFAFHKQEIIATNILDRLLIHASAWSNEHHRRPVIFHAYDWGGYLVWHGWPALRNWIDDRNEVQGKQRILEYFELLQAEPGWREKLTRVDFICIAPTVPLARALREDAQHWQELEGDEHAVLFVRLRPEK